MNNTVKLLCSFGLFVVCLQASEESMGCELGTPLFHAIEVSDVIVSAHEYNNIDSLIDAIQEREVENVRSLLEQGVNPNDQDEDGCKPLQYAVAKNNPEIVQLLCDFGSDVDVELENKNSLLRYAIGEKRNELVRILAGKSKNIEYVDHMGE